MRWVAFTFCFLFGCNPPPTSESAPVPLESPPRIQKEKEAEPPAPAPLPASKPATVEIETPVSSPTPGVWHSISKGVQYRVFPSFGDSEIGPRELHVVRANPRRHPPRLLMISREGGKGRSAAQWCAEKNLVVATNAGMYLTDFTTHVGYLRDGRHTNARWNSKYQSALVWGLLKGEGMPFLDILDIETPAERSKADGYRAVVQNLRLIKDDGKKVWKGGRNRWSEAAAAVDTSGRLLLLFSRSPYSMSDFSRQVLALPLNIVRAQHLEGGPEASLSVHGGGVDVDLSGSYETGFNENDKNEDQWPLPNIIAL